MATKAGTAIILVMIAASFAGAMLVTGAVTSSKSISNKGQLKAINVEVYQDSACTQIVSQIDWGALEPGSIINRTIYVKNTGNTALTLHLSTSNWNPTAASNYITLSWNKENVSVAPGAVVTAVLKLTVSSSISGISSFTFNIVVQGSG